MLSEPCQAKTLIPKVYIEHQESNRNSIGVTCVHDVAGLLWPLPCELRHTFEHSAMVLIRGFDKKADLSGVRSCLIELQDFERSLDSRMPSGAEIVDALIPHMLDRCARSGGRILVAELNEATVGFVTVLAKVKSEEIEDGEIEYGLVSDMVVASKYRKQGIGRKLLEAAELYARSKGVRWLRIGVLAENHSADGLYDSMGFRKMYIEREKELTRP